jgi:DNA/RNA-binding protein KIN17
MPKAEVGSTKYIANKMKQKGLQRLRWYCQICQKQCRDENGFKQHTQSEGHVRAMLLVGEDPKKYIEDYSRQFMRDFLQLLKTSHGEKKVHMNHFYQEYIRDKEHIHMNATKWPSLTEFAKHLGREGICRVEEGERGLEIQWIDDSPEAIRRREDVKRKEKLMKGDEDMEARLLERQIKSAREAAEKAGRLEEKARPAADESATAEPVKVSLSLSGKAQKKPESRSEEPTDAPVAISTFSTADQSSKADEAPSSTTGEAAAEKPKMSMSLGGSNNKAKRVNPLMAKNPLAKKNSSAAPIVPEKKMSEAERIMREEIERKRKAEERGPSSKRVRM